MMLKALVLAFAVVGTQSHAEAYADFGKPEQCGTYSEAAYDRESYFPGGEAGLIALRDAQPVRGLNALLFEGVMTEEGVNEPVGRMLAVRGPLVGAGGAVLAPEVVVITSEAGIRLLQRCP